MLAPLVVDPAAALTVSDLGRLVCGVASRFDAHRLDREGAALATREWSVIAHAAQAALALAAARVEECGPPPSAGAHDASEFVAKQTGTTTAKARETIRHGARMGASDKTRRAATSGGLSPEQASAITDAAAVNPEAEDRLLDEAPSSSVGELRQQCAKAKAEKQDVETIEKQIHASRCLRRYRDAEGAEHLHATGTNRDMALVDQALKPLIDEQFHAARTRGVREPLDAYAFDALVALAEGSLAEPPLPSSLEPGPASSPPPPARASKRRDPVRSLSVLRLDLSALVRGHVEPNEACEIAGLGPISVATAREMLGESVLKLVLTNGVEVRNVTHLGRGSNTAQKIALLWEQPLCRRKGCGRRARLEYDHSDGNEYRTTKHTRLDELDPFCEPDHDLKTYHGWALVEGTGIRDMVPPDDPRHPRYKGGPDASRSARHPPDSALHCLAENARHQVVGPAPG